MRSGAREVDACLEDTVGIAGNGRSAGPISKIRHVLKRTTYLGMNGLAVVNSMLGRSVWCSKWAVLKIEYAAPSCWIGVSRRVKMEACDN